MFYGTTPPNDPTHWPKAVGCFLEHDGRFVLLKRLPGKVYGGAWGLPGGKVNEREHPHEAMHRELWEETGIVETFSPTDIAEVVYVDLEKTGMFAYYMFKKELPYPPTLRLSPQEHESSRWFTPEEALSFTDLFPHTDDCIRLVYQITDTAQTHS